MRDQNLTAENTGQKMRDHSNFVSGVGQRKEIFWASKTVQIHIPVLIRVQMSRLLLKRLK